MTLQARCEEPVYNKGGLARYFRGMSCPQEFVEEDFIERVAVESARTTIRAFVSEAPPLISRRSHGLVDFLNDCVETQTLTLPMAWHFSVGNIAHNLGRAERHPNLLNSAASLSAHLMSSGVAGSWQANLCSPQRLLWGNYLLPTADGILVESDGETAKLQITYEGCQRVFKLRRTNFDWNGQAMPSILRQFGGPGGRIVIMVPDAVEPVEFDGSFPPAISPTKEMTETCQAALEFTQHVAPEYVNWITRLMRHVVLLADSGPIIQSCSTVRDPGLSYLSYSTQPASIAEMLIHEVSHQYFHLLWRIGPLVDLSDDKLYYSPLKKTGRRLDRILLGYHAFGNVVLFYRSCAAKVTLDETKFTRSVKQIGLVVEAMDQSLRDNPNLTALGRAIYEPISHRLAELARA